MSLVTALPELVYIRCPAAFFNRFLSDKNLFFVVFCWICTGMIYKHMYALFSVKISTPLSRNDNGVAINYWGEGGGFCNLGIFLGTLRVGGTN